MEIDVRKRKLEANALPNIKRIFRNMAKDAENIYRKNGNINTQELANNYYPEFLKEIRDMMRKTTKEFGFTLREDLQSKGLNFGIDLEIKEITDPFVKDKLKNINDQLRESTTFFIANESETQAKYITETNTKEIFLAISQEEQKFNYQKAMFEWAIIAKNIKVNLLDKSEARSELIVSQVIGLTESWTRQEEAELIDDEELEVDNRRLEIFKTWLAILDQKTRPDHVSADFQQVKLGDNFTVGGESLSYPRDPKASASNTINCRCIADYSNKFGKKSFEAKATETFKPTEEMAREAEKGLKWRKEYGRGGTAVGVKRANQLVNRENLSLNTVKRMYSFFSRHEVDKQAEGFRQGEKGYPSNGKIAWCLTHDTEILLADGTLETIGNIVDNKMNVDVMSKQDDGSIKPAKIINWLKLPSNKDEFMVLRRGKSKSNECGVVSKPKLYATKEHPIFTGDGYTKMENLTNNHKVAVVEEYIDDVAEQIILGHILGDGYLSTSGQLKINRGNEQLDYLEDTIKLTKNLNWSGINTFVAKSGFGIGKTQHTTSSRCIRYLAKNSLIKIENKKRVLIGDLDRLNDIAVSRWILDDGSLHKGNRTNAKHNYRLHIEGFNKESAFKIAKWFESKYEGKLNLHKRENCDGFVIYFGIDMTQNIAERIAKYVPYSMRYKLPESLRNIEYTLENHICNNQYKYSMQEINYIRKVGRNDDRNYNKFNFRYDLTIEGTHNFIANGVIVHNCLWGGDAGRTWATNIWEKYRD